MPSWRIKNFLKACSKKILPFAGVPRPESVLHALEGSSVSSGIPSIAIFSTEASLGVRTGLDLDLDLLFGAKPIKPGKRKSLRLRLGLLGGCLDLGILSMKFSIGRASLPILSVTGKDSTQSLESLR